MIPVVGILCLTTGITQHKIDDDALVDPL